MTGGLNGTHRVWWVRLSLAGWDSLGHGTVSVSKGVQDRAALAWAHPVRAQGCGPGTDV